MCSDWWKFNECMMSGTRSPVRNIRQGEEGVTASDLGLSENQAIKKGCEQHLNFWHMNQSQVL